MAAPLRELVTSEIRDLIIQGELEPGRRLIERELCEQLDVSRATLREAYRQLEAEGLILMRPNRGPTVAKMSSHEARDVYEVREAIECCAVRLFVERASKKQVDALRAAVTAIRVAYRTGTVSEMLSVKADFYDVLYEGADNSLLWEQARGLHHRLAQLRVRSMSQPGRPRTSLREIDAVYKAIRSRDVTQAESLWREHIRNAAAAALIGLDEPPHRPALRRIRAR